MSDKPRISYSDLAWAAAFARIDEHQSLFADGVRYLVTWKHFGYLLSPDCVHESMLMKRDTRRTFLRIALPLSYNV